MPFPQRVSAPRRSYKGLLFLSPNILVLLNVINHSLEFWNITSARPLPLGSLALPPLKDGYLVTGMSCHCQPNPISGHTPYSTLPFHAAPGDAIAMFKICLSRNDGTGPLDSVVIFVHRRTLLRLSGRFLHPDPAHETTQGVRVPWEEWGPDATRLLALEDWALDLNISTIGSRALSKNEKGDLFIMDFHPPRIQRTTKSLKDVRNSKRKKSLQVSVEAGETALSHEAFNNGLVSRLPYVVSKWAKKRSWITELILMDEERLVELVTVSVPQFFVVMCIEGS